MTLTIYKFNYNFHGTAYSLCFSLSEEINKQIDEWNLSLDKIVLEEQLRTGSFRGKFSIDDDLRRILSKMKDEGHIQPYYGMINARSYVYTLQISKKTCKVEVVHTVMEKKISLEDSVSIIRFNPLGILSNHIHGFMLKKQEYQTLLNWNFWNPKDEFSSRYSYTFSPTTVGMGTKILDSISNEEIDITDYNDW